MQMRKVCKKKVLNASTAEQVHNSEKYQNTKSITSFIWSAQLSDDIYIYIYIYICVIYVSGNKKEARKRSYIKKRK